MRISSVDISDFDACDGGLPLAKLTAANFCEVGAKVIHITEAGQRFIDSLRDHGKSEDTSQDSNLERSETERTPLATLQGIRIAILGPGLGGPSEPGLHKREKIRKVLQTDGHRPFFPEDDGVLVSDNPLEPLLEQERRLLISPDVQLIIVLHTSRVSG